MSTAFVLGNGLSRKELDLNVLTRYGTIYGCNALYRDFTPTVLVATDTPISETIQRSEYAFKHRFYTRKPLLGLGAQIIPEEIWGYSSGPVAVSLASQHGNSLVYLIGFDMGPASNGKFNNVYADTEFYKKSAAVPTYTGNWINQIKEITKKFSTTKFVRVVGPTTASINTLESISNLSHMPILDFQRSYK